MPEASESKLRDVRVLVTGATGFIGGRLAERLSVEAGARVTGTGRSLEKASWLEDRGVELERADLLETGRMRRLVEAAEVVFHLAAWAGGDPELAEPVNVEAPARLVRWAAADGAERFVHVSTVGAYRLDRGPTVDEETPLAPDAPDRYGRTKARGELRARREATRTGLELAVVRPAMVYGPRSTAWAVRMCRAVCQGKPVLVGDGSGHFHPVYVDDLVEALLACAARPEAAGQAFNVSDEPVTWREYAGYFAELCGREPRSIPLWLARLMAAVSELPGVDLPVDRTRLLQATNRVVFSTEKARTELDWSPEVGLDEGMARTAAWLRSEGYV